LKQVKVDCIMRNVIDYTDLFRHTQLAILNGFDM
jgi:hypothetical protein